MKMIGELVDFIDEEIEGAKTYAEKYLQLKAEGVMDYGNKFKSMANQELEHANIIHEYTVSQINKLNQVYTPPVEMQEIWDKSHKEYVEKTAWIRQMLAM